MVHNGSCFVLIALVNESRCYVLANKGFPLSIRDIFLRYLQNYNVIVLKTNMNDVYKNDIHYSINYVNVTRIQWVNLKYYFGLF